MFLVLNIDDLSRAVGVTGVVQVASLVPTESCIYYHFLVQTEEVAISDTFLFVDDLTFVCDFVSDLFSHILNYNISRVQTTSHKT